MWVPVPQQLGLGALTLQLPTGAVGRHISCTLRLPDEGGIGEWASSAWLQDAGAAACERGPVGERRRS